MKILLAVSISLILNLAYASSIHCQGQCENNSKNHSLDFKLSSGHGGSGTFNFEECSEYSLQYRWTGDGLLGINLFKGNSKIMSTRELWPKKLNPLELTDSDSNFDLVCFFE